MVYFYLVWSDAILDKKGERENSA